MEYVKFIKVIIITQLSLQVMMVKKIMRDITTMIFFIYLLIQVLHPFLRERRTDDVSARFSMAVSSSGEMRLPQKTLIYYQYIKTSENQFSWMYSLLCTPHLASCYVDTQDPLPYTFLVEMEVPMTKFRFKSSDLPKTIGIDAPMVKMFKETAPYV